MSQVTLSAARKGSPVDALEVSTTFRPYSICLSCQQSSLSRSSSSTSITTLLRLPYDLTTFLSFTPLPSSTFDPLLLRFLAITAPRDFIRYFHPTSGVVVGDNEQARVRRACVKEITVHFTTPELPLREGLVSLDVDTAPVTVPTGSSLSPSQFSLSKSASSTFLSTECSSVTSSSHSAS
jgi:hypothetical protein